MEADQEPIVVVNFLRNPTEEMAEELGVATAATRKGIKDLSRQLDDFLILFSYKFQVSIPAECFSKEYSAYLSQIGDESCNEKHALQLKGYIKGYILPIHFSILWELSYKCWVIYAFKF